MFGREGPVKVFEEGVGVGARRKGAVVIAPAGEPLPEHRTRRLPQAPVPRSLGDTAVEVQQVVATFGEVAWVLGQAVDELQPSPYCRRAFDGSVRLHVSRASLRR